MSITWWFIFCQTECIMPSWTLKTISSCCRKCTKQRCFMLFMCSLADDLDLEEFQLAIEESKLQTSIQCTPIPGKFNQQQISPCRSNVCHQRLWRSVHIKYKQTKQQACYRKNIFAKNFYTKTMHTSQNLHQHLAWFDYHLKKLQVFPFSEMVLIKERKM